MKKLIELDERLSYKLRVAENPGPLRQVANFIGHTGDSWYWGLLLSAVILIAPPIYKYWAVVSLLAVGVGATLVLGIKFTIRRKRPEGDMGEIYRKTDPHSFPSGHAVRAIMLGVIALRIAPPWLGITLILWGPLVGLARIAIGVHYISDVLAGWVLGLLFGWGVIALTAWLPTLFA
ncbi:MAG TPA: phosphatase PAP2 family protein [Anaerolineales bacterium]|nr:phosphatase PAP2 family protein [Anaerolineales bacterium]